MPLCLRVPLSETTNLGLINTEAPRAISLRSCKNIPNIFLFTTLHLSAQNNTKIGLTLSGGGAKGLAHIGILQAIESAELNVDYITGTNMGSIIGAMYAVGYSWNQIEEMARAIDRGNLFSGKPLMSNVAITEKDEFSNYAVELPFEKRKLKNWNGTH